MSEPLSPGISTKHYQYDDAIARLILPEFQERVDPKMLTMFLPHGLLTDSDEDRVVTKQTNEGRVEAARLLLALMAQRSDWVPRLQQGLRHREIRLDDLADKIDNIQREAPMEVDLEDGNALQQMETDAEPVFPETDALSPNLQALLVGRNLHDLKQGDLEAYRHLVMLAIAEQFFTPQRSVRDVEKLTELLERISHIIPSSFAIGCLELRLRLASSRDLEELRGMVERDVLRMAVEHAVLTDENCDWLTKKAASYGLQWRKLKVRIKMTEVDLDRCETFLRSIEVGPSPRTPAEALLHKMAANDKPGDMGTLVSLHRLPKLLLQFMDWLLFQYPQLAEKAAEAFVANIDNVKIVLLETMALCRQYFGLKKDFERDFAAVVAAMMEVAKRSVTTEGTTAASKVVLQLQLKGDAQSNVAGSVERLRGENLMVPCEDADQDSVFRFSSSFVEDFALTCADPDVLTSDVVHKSLFVVLQAVDLNLHHKEDFEEQAFASGVRSSEQFQRPMQSAIRRNEFAWFMNGIADEQRQDVNELLLPFSRLVHLCSDLILPTTVFGYEMKTYILNNKLTWLHLSTLSADKLQAISDTAKGVLACRNSIDLAGKLTDLDSEQLRVILACVQHTSLAAFTLDTHAMSQGQAVLTTERESLRALDYSPHLTLKLSQNVLTNTHVDCLLQALPGLESVCHIVLSGCTVSRSNLQRLLDNLNPSWVRGLSLSKIKYGEYSGLKVPTFCHLRRLRTVDLGDLGLQDHHMVELARQLRVLPDLRELNLEKNSITTAGLSALSPALAGCRSLRALHLAHCQLDAGAAFVLGSLLTSAHELHGLNLSHCRLLDSGLQHLSLVLKKHRLLSRVSLRDGGYTPHGLGLFLAGLADCSRMQHLELGGCPLELDEVNLTDKFLEALAGSNLWNYLGLWKCNVGHTSILQRLSALPTQLRGLTELVLQDNELKDEHISQLANAVEAGVFRYLSRLNLHNNHIREDGARALTRVLPLLPHLSELLLRCTAIPVDAALSLSRAALSLPAMTLLDLSDGYSMDDGDVAQIATELQRAVQDSNVVVNEGLKTVQEQAFLERSFADNMIEALGFQQIAPLGPEPTEPSDLLPPPSTTFAESKHSGPSSSSLLPSAERKDLQSPTMPSHLLVPSTIREEGIDTLSLSSLPQPTTPEELLPASLRYRQHAVRQGNDLIIDGTFHIKLGHR